MTLRHRLSALVILTSFFVYRSQYTLRNSIFYTAEFPDAYYAGGDAAAQCQKMADEVDDALKFCEDETFWDLFDAAEKLEERKVMGPLLNPEPLGSLWLYSPTPKVVQEVSTSFFSSKKAAVTLPAQLQRVNLVDYPEGHDFHPLGVKVYPSFGGNSSNVYVVNHARQRTFIEQFELSPATPTVITHVRTLSSPYFVSPNALALTSPDSFYVTNDHLLTRRLPLLGHIYPSSNPNPTSTTPIESHKIVAPFVPFSNGISISSTGERVAIASTSLSAIRFYARNTSTNALTFEESVLVPFCPDNIDYDDGDSLIVTGHPNFLTLVKLVRDRVPYAPSWVMSLSPRTNKVSTMFDMEAPVSASGKIPSSNSTELSTLFQSTGALLSSSSTGLRDTRSGNLYVTGLYGEPGLLVCTPLVS
ncbi:hypothetical protein CPB85DRAFT_1429099 [Mucidula mucida]|nr:hypothetical protein CPB85DRAFT_1429099 [Mucidula mucida]